MKGRLQLPMYIAAALAAANPVLLKGEIVYESDTGRHKIGNGASTWNALSYDGEDTQANMTTTGSASETILLTPGEQVIASSSHVIVSLTSKNVSHKHSADAILMVDQDSYISFEAGQNINRIFYGWPDAAEEFVPNARTCYTFHFIPAGDAYDVFANKCIYKPY